MQASLAFKTSCFGTHLWDGGLKSWTPDVGPKPFTPQGEAWNCEIPPGCMLLHGGWGLWQDCFLPSPTCFDLGFPSFAQCVGAALWFLCPSEGIIHMWLWIRCHGGWKVEGLLCCLEPDPGTEFLMSIIRNYFFLGFLCFFQRCWLLLYLRFFVMCLLLFLKTH